MQASKVTVSARVVSIFGTVYVCELMNEKDGATGVRFCLAGLAGKLRLEHSDSKHPVVVGDRVEVEAGEEHLTEAKSYEESITWAQNPKGTPKAVIQAVAPRTSEFGRKDDRFYQLLGANLDQVLIILSPFSPPIHWNFLFRLLVVAHYSKVTPRLFFNKFDLVHDALAKVTDDETAAFFDSIKGRPLTPEDREHWQSHLGTLQQKVVCLENETEVDLGSAALDFLDRVLQLGADFHCYLISAKRGWTDSLSGIVTGKFNLMVGSSGVGKSSLINCLQSDTPVIQRTSEVSEQTKKGRHTTTTSLCLRFDELNAYIVDTPGIKTWGVLHVDQATVLEAWPPLGELVDDCEFRDCDHSERNRGCALQKAAGEDPRLAWYLQSYQSIHDSFAEPWKMRRGDHLKEGEGRKFRPVRKKGKKGKK